MDNSLTLQADFLPIFTRTWCWERVGWACARSCREVTGVCARGCDKCRARGQVPSQPPHPHTHCSLVRYRWRGLQAERRWSKWKAL